MGVPFITLEGDTMVSRQGVSILKNAGLDTFIARDKKDYISKAVKISNNLDQVKEFRKIVGKRFQATLCSIKCSLQRTLKTY